MSRCGPQPSHRHCSSCSSGSLAPTLGRVGKAVHRCIQLTPALMVRRLYPRHTLTSSPFAYSNLWASSATCQHLFRFCRPAAKPFRYLCGFGVSVGGKACCGTSWVQMGLGITTGGEMEAIACWGLLSGCFSNHLWVFLLSNVLITTSLVNYNSSQYAVQVWHVVNSQY